MKWWCWSLDWELVSTKQEQKRGREEAKKIKVSDTNLILDQYFVGFDKLSSIFYSYICSLQFAAFKSNTSFTTLYSASGLSHTNKADKRWEGWQFVWKEAWVSKSEKRRGQKEKETLRERERTSEWERKLVKWL